jgi:hypothetical protein
MPGGTGGPHRIQGVGFWAQQKYYNIFSVDSGPFIFRSPFEGLPKAWWVPPANAFQSWTVNPSLPVLVTPPPLLGVTVRPPLKGLPVQGPTPLQQPAAFQSWLTLYGVVNQPFVQSNWPNATPPWRLDQTWTRSYNLNLIGQDAMLVGEQVYDLAPSQRPSEQIQLHSWAWSYNLSLVGKDRLPAGKQVVELTIGQRPPEQIQLHSWSWQYNLNLIGKDQLITGEQVTDLPPRDPREVRAWSWQYNLNLLGQDQLPIGEQTWVVPTPPYRIEQTWTWRQVVMIGQDQTPTGTQRYDLAPIYPPYINQLRTWAGWYNLNLVGRDWLPVGEQVWERPTLLIPPPALTWTESFQYELEAKPFLQTDWPNPTQPYRIEQTWAYRQVGMFGQDKLPSGEQISELPPRDARILQVWIAQTNIALLTQPPILPITISKYFDRPQLPIPPAQDWEWTYNQNLVGQDQLPARQSDWPNPIPPALVKDWIQQTNLALLTQPPALLPYKRSLYDLPNAGPQQAAQSWIWNYNLDLIGQDQLPAGAKVYELAPSQKPAEQPQLRSWTWWYDQTLIGQDELPFRQSDWPLTPAAQRAVDLATWLDRTKFLLQKPVAQYDWPNPTAFARDPTLATVARGYNLDLLGQDQLPNRQQDWPNPTPFADYTVLRGWSLPFNPGLNSGDLTKIARQQQWPLAPGPLQPDRGFSVPFNPNLPPTPPVVTPSVLNKPMFAGPGYLNVIPGEKPS